MDSKATGISLIVTNDHLEHLVAEIKVKRWSFACRVDGKDHFELVVFVPPQRMPEFNVLLRRIKDEELIEFAVLSLFLVNRSGPAGRYFVTTPGWHVATRIRRDTTICGRFSWPLITITRSTRMLILTRKLNEEIIIGRPGQQTTIDGEIVIRLCRLGTNNVRIGIQADEMLPIARREVLEREAQS